MLAHHNEFISSSVLNSISIIASATRSIGNSRTFSFTGEFSTDALGGNSRTNYSHKTPILGHPDYVSYNER